FFFFRCLFFFFIDDENIQYNAGNTTVQAVVTRAEGDKCPRCWHYTTDVGKVAEHADICGRCVSNIAGNGEQRKFA
ncbi:isoleucyl-tRNA ligase, partial [Salmonella enterica subsp. enterica serovar Newport str. SHSN004]|uniref:zinc finger domain-containing protein n=1 Tax=Salmonella enterica TaxID=28901 RepID=UPI000A1885F3